MNNQKFSQKILKVIQKIKKIYNIRDLVFLIYMILLCIFCLFAPIIKIESLGGDVMKFRLLGGNFVGTFVVVLLCLIVLFGWNFSTKFKNLFLTYFGGRENDSLINFLFLFIIITAFFSIQNATKIAGSATSTIRFTGNGNLILVLLLAGIIFTLVSVVKGAQKTGKKTKIINVVDDDHRQIETTKEEIKKGLFDEDTEN